MAKNLLTRVLYFTKYYYKVIYDDSLGEIFAFWLCCHFWGMEKERKLAQRSQQHPLVAQHFISSLLRQLCLCLPSRRWCMKVKRRLNSQSISSKIMTATLGQSPIGWWRMLCGRTAAAENTITTLLWLSVQTSCLRCWQMDTRRQWWMLLGMALFKYAFLESQELTDWRCQPAQTDGAMQPLLPHHFTANAKLATNLMNWKRLLPN